MKTYVQYFYNFHIMVIYHQVYVQSYDHIAVRWHGYIPGLPCGSASVRLRHYGIKYLTVLVAIIPQFYITLTEGRVGLLEVIKSISGVSVCSLIAFIVCNLAKIKVAAMICKHPELSDDKVKSITKMISKDSVFHIFKSN